MAFLCPLRAEARFWAAGVRKRHRRLLGGGFSRNTCFHLRTVIITASPALSLFSFYVTGAAIRITQRKAPAGRMEPPHLKLSPLFRPVTRWQTHPEKGARPAARVLPRSRWSRHHERQPPGPAPFTRSPPNLTSFLCSKSHPLLACLYGTVLGQTNTLRL